MANQNNCRELIKFLIREGGDVNQATAEGLTPIHAAYAKGRLEMVKFLIQCNAHLEVKNRKGPIAFDMVHLNNNQDILRFLTKFGSIKQLIRRGAGFHITNNNGETH